MLQRGRTIRPCIMAALAGAIALCAPAAEDPRPQSFRVREQPLSPGPRITPFLQYQAEQAWREDDDRQKAWDAIHDQRELLKTQDELRQKLQQMIGGLPAVKTDLHPRVTAGKPPIICWSFFRTSEHTSEIHSRLQMRSPVFVLT